MGNKRQKTKKNSWYDDGWWYDGYLRRKESLDKEHQNEMRNWDDYA